MKKLILILALLFCTFTPLHAANTDSSGSMLVHDVGKVVTPTIATIALVDDPIDAAVPAGARSLTFIFSNDFAGTILGVAFVGGDDTTISIAAPGADRLAAVAYTLTAGSFRLISIR